MKKYEEENEPMCEDQLDNLHIEDQAVNDELNVYENCIDGEINVPFTFDALQPQNCQSLQSFHPRPITDLVEDDEIELRPVINTNKHISND